MAQNNSPNDSLVFSLKINIVSGISLQIEVKRANSKYVKPIDFRNFNLWFKIVKSEKMEGIK